VRLENKVAVVTGSSSGIGEAIALAFAANGTAVVVNYSRHEDAAQEVLQKIEAACGKGLVVGADVSDPKEVEAMVQQAANAFGGLDIMVNNAGMERKIARRGGEPGPLPRVGRLLLRDGQHPVR
jgi:glucose 1-dehydrogenase